MRAYGEKEYPGECDTHDPAAAYGLLKLSGDFCRNKEVVSRFTTKQAADDACTIANYEATDPDRERYEVFDLRPARR